MNAENKLTRSEIKRAAIVRAAREVFLRSGFREANMDLIAERADVSKRTVYNHFPSKEDLFVAIAADLMAEFQRAVRIEFQPDRDVREQLLEFARREMDLLTSEIYVRVFRLFLLESHASPGLFEKILPADHMENNPLVDWIQAAVAEGALRAPDITLAATELHAMLKGGLFWPAVVGFRAAPTAEARDAVIQSAVDTFLARYLASGDA